MPAYVPIISGDIFGRLTVLEKLPEKNHRNIEIFKCQCSCAAKTIINVPKPYLTSGDTKSCGCLRKETTAARRTIHGMSETPEYEIWCGIKKRCYNPKSKSYPDYGARGITMSDEWKDSFEAFYQDMGPRPSLNHSIEREKNDQGYSKDNCKWATREEQNNNTRTNVFYEINGERLTVAQIAKKYNKPYNSLIIRLQTMSVKEALNKPLKKSKLLLFTYNNKTQNLAQWCRELYLDRDKMVYCIKKGMLFEVAIIFTKDFRNHSVTINNVIKTVDEWTSNDNLALHEVVLRLRKGWTIEEALNLIQLQEIYLGGETKTLKEWCGVLGYEDPDKIYLRVIRGETLDQIVSSNTK